MGSRVFQYVVDLALRGQYLGLGLLVARAASDRTDHVLCQSSRAPHEPLVQPGSFMQSHFSLRFALIENAC